jgi:hypothetical protein
MKIKFLPPHLLPLLVGERGRVREKKLKEVKNYAV